MDLSTGHAKSKKEDSDELSGTVVAEEASAKRVRTAEDGPGEDEDADEDLLEEVVETGEGGGKKEKAVKVKKIFLRILRKVMDVPQDSPLVRICRMVFRLAPERRLFGTTHRLMFGAHSLSLWGLVASGWHLHTRISDTDLNNLSTSHCPSNCTCSRGCD
eukprot:1255341-Pyramimonas_sp.AAC.1